jgi:hypothetical protein
MTLLCGSTPAAGAPRAGSRPKKQHGASTRIFQFCTDLVVERALSSRQMRAPEPLRRDRPRKPSQRSGVAQAVDHGLGFT